MKTPKTSALLITGVLACLVLAGGVALFASSSPDGLESVMLNGCDTGPDGEITGGECVAQSEADHEVAGPLADYGVSFLGGETLGSSIAGITGVLLALGAGTGLFWLLARKRPAADGEDA